MSETASRPRPPLAAFSQSYRYYIWIYWMNFMAWLLRGLAVNEFDSGAYDTIVPELNVTKGEAILTQFGFTLNDEPFTYEWIAWGILVSLGMGIGSVALSNLVLKSVRFATGRSLASVDEEVEVNLVDLKESVENVVLPFQKVDLTFKEICYTVQASTSNEKLQLLKGISGVIAHGKLTALMGSSGAGKTTLMDVLAMRKSSGEIEGEICLNGHPQDEHSFRRCTGYVEQFDTQSPQLTIRETVEFSAKLRLEETDPAVTPESTKKFVDQTLDMLELTSLQDLQVGSDEGGGLSFEQKKRLSIAVELVANPSILFLDEPTSGLVSA